MNYRCFLDLDGVLVNFQKGWLAHHSLSSPIRGGNYNYGISNQEFWKDIGDDFWINLEWMEDGREILELVERVFKKENICLVTHSPYSIGLSGKVQWIAKNVPSYLNSFMIGTGRRFFGGRRAILIDDSDRNVKNFHDYGGTGILVPRFWNSMHNCSITALEYLSDRLISLVGENNG